MFQNNSQTIHFTLGCLNVVKMTQAQYPIDQAAWSFNLAAMFLPKALAILCSVYLQITGNIDLSNKGGLFIKDGAKFPKLSLDFLAQMFQMGIEWTSLRL